MSDASGRGDFPRKDIGMKTLERAQRFLARQLGVAETEVTTDSGRVIDGATRAALLRDMEEAFGIRFSKDLLALETLGGLVAAAAWELAQHRTRKRRS